MKKDWFKTAVVYQVYPNSFYDTTGNGYGDIKGIIQKLDYIKSLGVNAIWLNPVYTSPLADNGYDVEDYLSINPLYGTMNDMEELISKAKEMGIYIIMDIIPNHSSDQHHWFKEARKSKDNPYRDYYIWAKNPDLKMDSIFGGSAWEYDELTQEYYYHMFAKEQPDLNWDNPKVRKEFQNILNFWIEKDIGGFRFDVIDNVGKIVTPNSHENSKEKLHKYVKEMVQNTWKDKSLLTVGESWGSEPEDGNLYSQPDRKEFAMIFQFQHIMTNWNKEFGKFTLNKLVLSELKKSLNKWQIGLRNKGWNSLFWANHDFSRTISRWGNDKEYRVQCAKTQALCLHLLQGTPYIYQGEEIGCVNVDYNLEEYNDVEIHGKYSDFVLRDKLLSKEEYLKIISHIGRDNARVPMQWDDSKNAGFSKSNKTWLKVGPTYKKINVKEQENRKDSILNWYKTLIKLRRDSKYTNIIKDGLVQFIDINNNELFAFSRKLNGLEIFVFGNWSDKKIDFPNIVDNHKIILNNYETLSDKLLPWQCVMIERKLH